MKKYVVIQYPDERLNKIAEEVGVIDHNIRNIIYAMIYLCIKKNALGLAAPQIGVNKRIIVYKTLFGYNVLINPIINHITDSILEETEDFKITSESCLSIGKGKKIYSKKRYKKIFVRGEILNKDKINFIAEELIATIIQHEVDHLDGRLIND